MPDHVEQYVKSVTHRASRSEAVKLRLTRSGARSRARVRLGGEALLGPADATYALVAHETGHLVPSDVVAGPMGRLGQLASAVDRVVVLPEVHQGGSELGVTEHPAEASTWCRSRWKGTS